MKERASSMDQSPASSGPYSKTRMRTLAAMTALGSILALILGAKLTIDGAPNGVKWLILGGVSALVAAVGIPFGIRRGRLGPPGSVISQFDADRSFQDGQFEPRGPGRVPAGTGFLAP